MADSFERTIFVDTSAIAAIVNKNDQFHHIAVKYYKHIVEAGYTLILTNFVIAETHALLLKNTHNISLGLTWINDVAYEDYIVIRPSPQHEQEAIHLLNTYHDKAWSFTDAISFRIMELLEIPYYFSFDDDFRQVGKFIDIVAYLEKN